MFGEFAPKVRGAATQGAVPAGTIIDWWQQDANTLVPTGWSLCNGLTATWQTGPRAGKLFTKPNLIGMYTLGGDVLNGSSTANSNGFGSITPQSVEGTTTHYHAYTVYDQNYAYGPSGYSVCGTYGTYDTYAASSAPAAQVLTKLIKL
jgi:hypothetical protein